MDIEIKEATKGWRKRFGIFEDERYLEVEDLVIGLKVRFAHPNSGYPTDQERAKEYLELGAVYTISNFLVDAWYTNIWLVEVPDMHFNSVMFNKVDE